MVDEIDIYRTVKMFIEWHGDDAALQASMKTDEMLEAGEVVGQAAWKRIINAIDELLSEFRPNGIGEH
ncbi:MAG: hypothetical protein HN578_04115 [Rhodospirillales bacterium]|jgi:hypothetical protein|nr:hypothetical protein [Rhodospirillaceae bacterium]MBT7485830.1 hypothetical protein [Rhodospirillales bacterium]MBT8002087.1 hypothetical protein [Rhodospirillales bacterium]